MIKNRLFIAFLAFGFVSNIQSMEPEKTFPFADLPLEMQQYVVKLMSVTSGAKSLKEAGKTISALAVTNTEWNEVINEPKFCLRIIKNLAQQFGCSEQEAAEALGTQEAKRRLGIQKQFFDMCNQAIKHFKQEDFNNLLEAHGKYVDLNFTYYIAFREEGFEPENIETTLLALAINAENCPLIKILLTHGVNINQTDADGYSLLNIAIDTNNTDIVACILENSKPDIDLQDDEGMTALISAAKKNNCAIIKLLLTYGADINKADYNGVTALMIAANWGNVEAVQCLLRNSHIQMNKRDKFGGTAFMHLAVAEQNSCPMLEIFLRYGADINQADDEGITALMSAIPKNNMNLFECLVYNRTIIIDQPDKRGMTALMWAVRYNNCPMIKILLDRGADVNKRNNSGMTPLMKAAHDGQIDVVQCLFDNANVAINQRTQAGLTALMFAVHGRMNNILMINLLLGYGADLNQKDIKGWTALMKAISLKDKPIIKLLLNVGANPKIAADDGLTPLQLAKQTGDKEIIDRVVKAIKK